VRQIGPIFTSARSRTRTLVALALLLAVVAAVTLGLHRAVPGLDDPAWLRNQVASYGPLAPVVFVLAQATQVVVAPVPGQVLAFVGGYLFGPVWGTLLSLVGATFGSAVAFSLARRYGRPYVERVVTEDALDTFDGLAASDGRFALFLAFLVPGLPDDAICFVAGISRVPIWQLVVISAVGRVPGYAAVSYAGARFATAHYVETALVLVVVAALAALVYWRKDELFAVLG
jgi:uncharacterized membrane protein YdjX (TVP38/TMEM64 family)